MFYQKGMRKTNNVTSLSEVWATTTIADGGSSKMTEYDFEIDRNDAKDESCNLLTVQLPSTEELYQNNDYSGEDLSLCDAMTVQVPISY